MRPVGARIRLLKLRVYRFSLSDKKQLNLTLSEGTYTKASLRLQPTRRNHGGRVYDHVAVKQEKDFKPLEAIRVEKEKGLWAQLAYGK